MLDTIIYIQLLMNRKLEKEHVGYYNINTILEARCYLPQLNGFGVELSFCNLLFQEKDELFENY